MKSIAEPPRVWQSFRDDRDGTVITVVRVNHWRGPLGYLSVEVDGGQSRHRSRQHLNRDEFQRHFALIYDPYTGREVAA